MSKLKANENSLTNKDYKTILNTFGKILFNIYQIKVIQQVVKYKRNEYALDKLAVKNEILELQKDFEEQHRFNLSVLEKVKISSKISMEQKKQLFNRIKNLQNELMGFTDYIINGNFEYLEKWNNTLDLLDELTMSVCL